MAVIDVPGRRVHGKIVYYGPGFGGKTTNLRHVHARLPPGTRRELREVADEAGRTVFCDVLPLDLGTVGGVALRYDLYTVAGQARYEDARAAVLHGADGAVFVADARAERLPENLRSFEELVANVAGQGKAIADFPLVLQYNKTDLPDALPASELDRRLPAGGAPRFPAVARDGVGVVETLREICRLVTRGL
jgi:signal recognition particle receptor subunit beta